MRTGLIGRALFTVFATAIFSAAPAFALASSPPPNDTLAGAISFGDSHLPFDATVDTSAATTDANDVAINDTCGAPATEASVWYRYTAGGLTDFLLLDLAGTDYSAGVIVATGDPVSGWTLVSCGQGTISPPVTAGTTYTILAFGDVPGAGGGTLVFHAAAVTTPTVSIAANARGKVDRAGDAIVSGTYSCLNGPAPDMFTMLTQVVGRFKMTGFGYATGPCDGTTQPWTSVVTTDNGKFAGGKATLLAEILSCSADLCGYTSTTVTIHLSGGGKP